MVFQGGDDGRGYRSMCTVEYPEVPTRMAVTDVVYGTVGCIW
jgi:hypothetical protein